MQKIHLQWLTLTILRLLGRVSIQLLLGCLCLILLSACQGKPLPVGRSFDRDEDLGPPGSDRETDPNPPPVKAFKVRINEVMVSNTDILTNPTGGAWIELYNPTDEPIDLSGLPLSDDLLKANRWLIPRSSESVISPRGYLVIYCDGDPNRVGGLHSNFALQPGSLSIILNKGSDLFFFDATLLEKGRSAGRAPDGAKAIRALATPTPGAPNSPAEGVFIPHAGSDETFCSLRKVAAARARGARRPSGAEEGEAACRGRRGGGSASPTSRNEQQT